MSDPLKHVRVMVSQAQAFQREADAILSRAAISSPLLIGLGGRRTAGKDTVADHLVSAHGFHKLGMSDPLATALYTLNPLVNLSWDGFEPWAEEAGWTISDRSRVSRYQDIQDIAGYTMAKQIPEVRRLLQVLGTEVGRLQLGEDTWTRAAERTINHLRSTGTPVALTGVRFSNELALVRRLGGVLVHVERPSLALDGEDTLSLDTHASEQSLTPQDFDYVLHNDGSIETLKSRTDELISSL